MKKTMFLISLVLIASFMLNACGPAATAVVAPTDVVAPTAVVVSATEAVAAPGARRSHAV